jgi:ketosteroid isomerase-like protein
MGGAELMRKVIAGFEKSDLRPLFGAMHDEIVWKSASNHPGFLPFSGEYRTRSKVTEHLAKLSFNYTFYRMEPKEILEIGNIVWGLFDVRLHFDPKGTGLPEKSIALEMAIRWQIEDGKIVEHRAFFDTASLFIQQSSPQP